MVIALALGAACRGASPAPRPATSQVPAWDLANPVRPLPTVVADGIDPQALSPHQVRLGRWLYYDEQLTGVDPAGCTGCHDPGSGHAPAGWFGIDSRGRQQTPIVGPMLPVTAATTHAMAVRAIADARGYKLYFRQSFGSEQVTLERLGAAISAYVAVLQDPTNGAGDAPPVAFPQ